MRFLKPTLLALSVIGLSACNTVPSTTYRCYSMNAKTHRLFSATEATPQQARYKAVQVCNLYGDAGHCMLSARGCNPTGYADGRWVCQAENTQTHQQYLGHSPLKKYAFDYANFYCSQAGNPEMCGNPVCHFEANTGGK